MRVLHHIRHDVSLRNFTVYAQWAAFSAIIACWIEGVWWLAVVISSSTWKYYWTHFFGIIQILNVVLFPLGPVAVIMPYLSKYNRYLFWMGMLWWYLLPIACFFASTRLSVPVRSSDLTSALLYLFTDIMFGMGTVLIYKNPHTLRYMIYFNLAFMAWISLWVGDIALFQWQEIVMVKPRFVWPMVLAAVAAVLYTVAMVKGRDLVLSRTLGGPGIEPMSLTLHSSEPEYNTITNEGRIQLT